MLEDKMLGFENHITGYIYLEFANNNKLFYQQSRSMWEMVKATSSFPMYDENAFTLPQMRMFAYAEFLKQWYENRQEKNLSRYKKDELECLFTYALSRINWQEIAATLISDIEEP